MSVLSAHSYAMRRAVGLVRRSPLSFVLAVLLGAIALTWLFVLATFGIAWMPATSSIRPAAEISVFVAPATTRPNLATLQARLAALPKLQNVRLVGREAALADLAKRVGDASHLEQLPENPLPDVLIGRVAASATARELESIVADIRGWPNVDAVRADLDWYRKVSAVQHALAIALAIFGLLTACGVALIVLAAVRLMTTTQRAEFDVLRLAGASRRFIVRPYAYAAAAMMGLAAALAVGATIAVHAAVTPAVSAAASQYGAKPPLALPPSEWAVAAMVAAAVLGAVAGALAARLSLPAASS